MSLTRILVYKYENKQAFWQNTMNDDAIKQLWWHKAAYI